MLNESPVCHAPKKHFSGHPAGQSGVPAFPRLLMVEHRAGHDDRPGFHIYITGKWRDNQRLRRRAARAARASRLRVAACLGVGHKPEDGWWAPVYASCLRQSCYALTEFGGR